MTEQVSPSNAIGILKETDGGVLVAVDAEGNTRELKAGDSIHAGDSLQVISTLQIVISNSKGEVEQSIHSARNVVAFADGTVRELPAEGVANLAADNYQQFALVSGQESNDTPSFEELIAAIGNGEDINELLEETAAGEGTGNGSDDELGQGVRFERIEQSSNPEAGIDPNLDFAASLADQEQGATDQPANILPQSLPLSSQSGSDGEQVTFDVSANFNDADGVLTFTAVGLPDGLSIDSDTGVISGTISSDASNTDGNSDNSQDYTVVITATDNAGAEVSETFVWTVENILPEAQDDNFTTDEDMVVEGNLLLNNGNGADVDGSPDSDALTVNTTPVSGPANGTVVLNADGTFTYTPNNNFNGSDSFTYSIDDGQGGTDTGTVTITINDATDLTAGDDIASGDEDAVISDTVADNDSTDSGGTLTYALETDVSNGSLVFNADGSYDYTPDANFNGADSFTYTVTDSASGESSTQTVNLTVNPITDLTAGDDSASGDEDTVISDTVAGNDSTTSGGTLTYALETDVSNGSLVFNADGSYDYTPDANFNGNDSFTYTVTDADSGESSTQTVNLTVNPVTDLTAGDDSASGDEDTVISDTVAGNDSTTSGGTLSYALETDVSNGSLVFNADGSYDYTPDANFNGADSFTYTVTDSASGESSTQTVNLTVNPVTDLTAGDDSASGDEDTVISDTVAGNDSTTSGGTLSYALETDVSNGSLVFNADGSYDYTPDANFNGADSFTYTVTDADSGESSTQTVNLTVNPVADLTAGDDSASGDEDTVISDTVAGNDSTTSGGTLTYALETDVSNGSLVFNADGSYDYTPDANFNGADSFTYTVTDADSGESSTQSVNLTVNPVTDLTAGDDSASGDEDTVISDSVAGNDSTTSGGTLSYALETDVNNGSLVFNADGSYDYTPDANFNGADSFTYTVTDADSGESSTQTVNLTVNPVADLTAGDDSASGDEDTVISDTVAGNDSTTSGGTLTYALETDVSNGSLVFNADGSYDYTPDANFNGADSFTYTVTDADSGESSTQTVNLTVNPVADLTAGDDSASGDEDTVISDTVAGNDSTTSGGTLTYALETDVSNGSLVFNADGSYDYTPDANFNGADSFTYTVTDADSGESSTQTVNLTVNPVADLTAGDDSASGDEDTVISDTVAGNDSTTSGGTLTYALETDVSNGSLVFNADGSYDYTPDANFNGADSFTYTVTDSASGESSTQTVNLTVNPVADLTAGDDSASGDEDTVISDSVAGNDSTTSGGTLSYVLETDVSNGSLVFNADGSYDYTPDANFNGNDSFTYTVTDADSGESSTQTVNLTVNPVTDLTAGDDTASGDEDTVISDTVAGNDSTTSGGTLTYALETDVSNGSLVFNADGSYDYTPDANFNGADSFTYTVTDADSGESSIQTVNLTVNPVTDLTAGDDSASGDEDTVISDTVAGNDSTTSGGTLTYALETDVSNGSLIFNADGSYDYTPDTNFNGADSFTYTVTDAASGESSTQTVNLTINPLIDAPSAIDAFITVSEEGLANALADNSGTPSDTTDSPTDSASVVSNPDSQPFDVADVTLSTSAVLTSGGQAVAWSGGASGAPLVGTIDGGATEIIRVTVDTNGDSQILLSGPVDHAISDVEDVLSFDVTVGIDDGVSPSSGTLTVNIEDDSPLVSPTSTTISDGVVGSQMAYNVIVVLDVSGSMDDIADTNGNTRLELSQAALNDFASALYAETEGVSITLVTFASGAQNEGTFTNLTDFSATVNGLTAGGGTNYNASLAEANQIIQDQLGQERPENIEDLLYFISDGVPTVGGTVDPSLLTAGIADQDLPTVYSIGIGAGVDEGPLDLVIPGVQQPDPNGDPVIVTEIDDLADTLTDLFASAATAEGNFLTDATTAEFGADGGSLSTITFGGVDYTIASPEVTGTLLSVTNATGTLEVDFATGDYQFFGDSEGLDTGDSVTIGYTLTDADNDSFAADLTVSVVENQTPVAEALTLVTNADGDFTVDSNLFSHFGTDPEGENLYLFETMGNADMAPYGNSVLVSNDFNYQLVDDRGAGSNSAAVDVVRSASNNLTGTAGRDLLIGTNGSVELDVREGSTYNNTTLFGVSLANVAAGLSVTQIVIDLSGVANSFFDPNTVANGGTPFTVGETDGISAADISSTLSNSNQTLTIDIASGSLESGESFRFGIDTDGNNEIGFGDRFGQLSVPVQITLSDGTVISGNFDSGEGATSIFSSDLPAVGTVLDGAEGDDVIEGSLQGDTIIGGSGDDVLIGGGGSDTFTWQAGDAGGGTDTITDFTVGDITVNSEADILDLSDLLVGENSTNLDEYLSFSLNSDGDTVITIDTDGSGAGGDTQEIVLQGVDLVTGNSQTQIIDGLINDQNLLTD